MTVSRGVQRSANSCAGGNPVVDDDGRATPDLDRGSLAEVPCASSLDLHQLLAACRLEIPFRNTERLNDVLIADDRRRMAVDDGTHGQFRLEGGTDLADQEQVEWRLQRLGDRCRYRNTATRKRQHDGIGVAIFEERGDEPSAGLPTICKRHVIL